ncbi:uncharacterized protein LOC128678869 [Plodia interpunctella]|uniref:uncharacterized protein LOC128678869 n=1 Tax=Plodia interpunctella TaxID=58824 RepID=UPI002368B2AC|nr:uncharacterized protein LOC128678869 [Plodia interpunctella]
MEQWLGLPSVEDYHGLNLYNLSLNSAYVIANTTLKSVFIYAANDLCYECPFNLVTELRQNEETTWIVDTSMPYTWRLMKKDLGSFSRNIKRGILCEMRPTLKEFGVYRLDIGRCEAKPLVPTYNSYFPLILFTSMLLVCGGIYAVIKFALKCRARKDGEAELSTTDNERAKCVHFYRGVLLLLLIFITSGAGGYPVFSIKHGGLSVADCLFCVYAWTIGIKIPTAMDEAVSKGKSKRSIFGDIFIRSFILILLGITIESTLSQFPTNVPTLWRPLEMVGVAYLLVGTVYFLSVHKLEIKSENIFFKMISNLTSLVWCWIIASFVLVTIIIFVTMLASYNCIIKIPLTSTEYTYVVPEQSTYCNNEFTKWVNLLFTGEAEKTILVDGFNGFSGGILGLLSTTLSTLIGVKAGYVYLNYDKHTDRIRLWALWGLLFSVGAVVFAGISYAVKCNLWPISSILFVTASSHFFLITIYVLTEYYNCSSIVTALGETSLPILAGHLLFSKSLPFSWPAEINNHSLFLLQNIWIVLLWISIAVFLRRNKISFPV